MSGKYRKGIFIVVYRKDGGEILYLVLKRKLHWSGWEFPKGAVEDKESVKKAIIREIKEETGQKAEDIKNYELKGQFNYDKEYKDRKNIIGQDWKLFSCEIKNKDVRVDNIEHSDYRWLEFDKAVEILRWPNQMVCLEAVDKKISGKKQTKFRKFKTSSGIEILSGKNAEQNEELVKKFVGKDNIIMHTSKPGSPFSVALTKPEKKDEKEIAIFTAKYSQDWKKNKNDVEVHIFSGKNVYKKKNMKIGTFGVRKLRKIKIKRKEIEKLE